jgi:pimeloyl-ACP methyl ester carboxylesterase
MTIKGTSTYKDPEGAKKFLEEWNYNIQLLNNSFYEKIYTRTSLGKTIVWGYNTERTDMETIIIFPGFRTCGMFWDLDNGLAPLKNNYRIFLVDINGQPCLSDGNSPDIKTNDYGIWATELFEKLNIKKATIIGASFGGIISMKLCFVSPHLVEKAILMNPAGISNFSSSLKNLYFNFLPIILKSKNSVIRFVNKIALHPPQQDLPPAYRELLIEFILFTLKNFQNQADLPVTLNKNDLKKISTDIYLVLGENDLLFPPEKTISIAKKNITTLKNIKILANTAHGIETSKEAMNVVAGIMKDKHAHEMV